MWVKFSDRKPKNGSYLIVRGTGAYVKIGDSFESFEIWDNDNLKTHKPGFMHWWDGEPDFDLAVESWQRS